MAQLKHTVVAGGVKYSAGTSETPELRELINDKHWGEIDASSEAASARDSASQVEILELRELAAAEIAKRDVRIVELEAEVERLTAERDKAFKPPELPPEPVDYLAKTGKDLKDEIDRRNADRGASDVIVVAAPGNKPDLAAALVADDARLLA